MNQKNPTEIPLGLASKVIMNRRTTATHKFRTRLGTIWCHFKQRAISANENEKLISRKKYVNTK